MPYFQYTAVDAAGKQTQGTIQAGNAGEALHMLIGRGFRAPRIVGERQTPAAAQAAPAQRPIQQHAPAGQVQINAPAAAYAPKVHRSKKSTDKDIFFLFSQIGEQLRAGIGPVQAFNELSRNYKDSKYRDSLAEVATAASEGKPISSILELWPDLYPEHVVGLIKAGETGGFLPEAATTVAQQAEEAHKFKRFHWWVWLVVINALLSFPLVFMAHGSFLKYVKEEMARPNSHAGGPFAVLLVMLHQTIWPWGPITIAVCILCWLLRNWLSTRSMRRFRHQLGLKTPVLGRRARDESVTIFSWVLSKLAKGGVPPNRSWELAVASVPNLGMQDKLTSAGRMMNEGSRLSDVVFKSELFPQEYAPTIATGEMTGDIPGALERLSRISRAEFDASTVKSKVATGSAGCTALIVTLGIGFIVIALAWSEINHMFLQQANDPDSGFGTSTSSGPSIPDNSNVTDPTNAD